MRDMKEDIIYLAIHAPFFISCIPNAGLPENIGGIAHYRLTPIELQMQLMHFIEDLGVSVIGGCCGTTPDHISELSKLVNEINVKRRDDTCLKSKFINLNTKFYSSLSILLKYSKNSESGDKIIVVSPESIAET